MRIARAALILAAVGLAAGQAVGSFEPNDDFASRAILDPGVTTVSDTITAGVAGSGPDTTLAAFTAGGLLIEVDDDSSPLGDGLASALQQVTVNSDGTIRLKISGYPDMDPMDGNDDDWGTPHLESGPFDLSVTVFDSGDVQIGSHDVSASLVAGSVYTVGTITGYGGSDYFNAIIDNTPSTLDDVMDFMTFTSLAVGEHFEATVTAGTFDALLGRFDNSGVLIEYDDDGGAGLLSNISGTVPGDGQLHLAVTGYADVLFQGDHAQSGDYTLSVALPAPGDANVDGYVDGLDYVVWSNNFGLSDTIWREADFNDTKDTDGLDYVIWSNNYAPLPGGLVPEPATAALLAVGAVATILSGRRRRR